MLSNQEILLRLFLSAILGGLIGLERERLDWAAGLRTHMLVCIGSTVIMLVSAFGFADVLNILHPAKAKLKQSEYSNKMGEYFYGKRQSLEF